MAVAELRIRIGVLLCFGSFMALPCGATDTRVETMGGSGLYLEDDADIWIYPSALSEYGDRLAIGLGGSASSLTAQSVLRTVATLRLVNRVVIGVAMGNERISHSNLPLAATEQMHLLLSAPFGKNTVGFHLSRWGAINSDAPSFERSVAVTRLAVGLERETSTGNTMETALSGSITNFKDLYGGQARTKPQRYYDLGLAVRGRFKINSDSRIVPVLNILAGERSISNMVVDPGARSRELNHLRGQAGVALERRYESGLLLISHLCVAVDYESDNYSAGGSGTEIVMWELPRLGFGIEKSITAHLAIRLGCISRVLLKSETVKSGSETERITSTETAPTFGLGWRYQGFQADWAIDPSLLQGGPFLISGRSAPLTTKITVAIDF